MAMSYNDLVARARAVITEGTVADLAADPAAAGVLVDVREADEWEQGRIPGAVHLARGVLEGAIGRIAPDLYAPVTLYCEVGARSALAALSLQAMGYTDVRSLAGGFVEWKAAGLPWDIPTTFTNDQRARYARHVMLPEVGEAGQRRLLGARVLIVGAGGLGSPTALYLAAAGVGTIGIVDFDRVDATNLQRQILHDLDRVGEKKVESARQTIGGLNSDVKVETHDLRLAAANVLEVLDGYELVVDGADNFPTRYLLNDASIHLGIPVVHGSIFRFEGQVSVFDAARGPCYRCLFPEAPPPELAPNCAEAGVLGVLPGVIGTLQATEALKLLLGIGDPLVGRLLTYDALDQEFRTLRLSKRPGCPSCGAGRLPELVDYEGTCEAR